MLVLLPPSEGKTPAPPGAAPVALDRLSFPRLGAAREAVLGALVAVSQRPDAAAVLGLGSRLAGELARNARLPDEPAAPAAAVYSGVLFDALGLAALPETARRRARGSVLVCSALWGAVRPTDRVPAYRLAMAVDLPGLGSLAAHWRAPLAAVLPAEAGDRGVVVDCRSAAYAAAWRPTGDLVARTVAVRVRSGDAVVSHAAKHTRGLVVRHLLVRASRPPASVDGLVRAVAEEFEVELAGSRRSGWRLDVQAPV